MNLTLLWLIIFVVCIAVEIGTMGLTTIWFAGGALIASIVAAIGAPIWLQVVLFFGVSFILLYYSQRIYFYLYNYNVSGSNTELLFNFTFRNTLTIDKIPRTIKLPIRKG